MKIKLIPSNREYEMTRFSESYNVRSNQLVLDGNIVTSDTVAALKEEFTNYTSFEVSTPKATVTYTDYDLDNIMRGFDEDGTERVTVRFHAKEN